MLCVHGNNRTAHIVILKFLKLCIDILSWLFATCKLKKIEEKNSTDSLQRQKVVTMNEKKA